MTKQIMKTIKLRLGYFRRIFKREYLNHFCYECCSIIHHPIDHFSIYAELKPDTWETNSMAEVYEFFKRIDIVTKSPAQRIYKIPNAIVYNNSDIVKTEGGVLWDKAFTPEFSATIPKDENLLSFDENTVKLVKYNKIVHIKGRVLSLLGVHAGVWAHFLVQYLCKLYYAKMHDLFSENITVLVPPYKDIQVRDIVNAFFKDKSTVKVIEVQSGISYACEVLYYLPSCVTMGNHATYLHPCNYVFTDLMKNTIKEFFVLPYIEQSKETKTQTYSKIYIPRRGGYRSLVNNDEIEEYFRTEGFHFVDFSKVSLLKKIKLVNSADIIAGPISGGFTNCFFCKKGAKILGLSNIPRTMETYLGGISPTITELDILLVTGYDTDLQPHACFKIPLVKVKSAYNYLLSK